MKAKGWREIDRSKTPQPKRSKAKADVKSRITIYLDADIVSYYKEKAEETGSGYQTLINQSLREMIYRHGKAENYDNAIEAFNSVIEISGKDKTFHDLATTLHNLAIAHETQEKYEEAIELFNEALNIKSGLDIKKEILKDKNFLHKLKEALALKS